MKTIEAERLKNFGHAVPWGPVDENRPNEDRDIIVRVPANPGEGNSEFYQNVFHDKPIDYTRWSAGDKYLWRVLPAEQKHRSCAKRLALEVGMFRALVVEAYGEEGYQIMDAVYSSFAEGEYQRGIAKGTIDPNPDNIGPIEAANYIATVYDIEYLQPFVVPEANNERVRLQGTLNTGAELCSYGTRAADHRFCENTGGWERNLVKLMNPKLRTRVTKTRNCGDYCCEVLVEWDDGNEFPEKDPSERPEVVRPELEHSEIYNKIVHGTPINPKRFFPVVAAKTLPWEVKHKACASKFSAESGSLRTMIGEIYGDEGYALIEKAYTGLAQAEYDYARKRGLIKDPEEVTSLDVIKYIAFLYDVTGRGQMILNETDGKATIQHSHGIPATCNYLTRQGDWKMCTSEVGFEVALTKLMNPKLKASRTKGKVCGDYCCELTVELD